MRPSRNAVRATSATARSSGRPRASFAGPSLSMPEKSAAPDLLERAPQLRLEHDRDRHRGADEHSRRIVPSRYEMEEVRDSEQPDQHQNAR